jgi:hypothetical protein
MEVKWCCQPLEAPVTTNNIVRSPLAKVTKRQINEHIIISNKKKPATVEILVRKTQQEVKVQQTRHQHQLERSRQRFYLQEEQEEQEEQEDQEEQEERERSTVSRRVSIPSAQSDEHGGPPKRTHTINFRGRIIPG